MLNYIIFDVEILDIRVFDMGGKIFVVCLEESVIKDVKFLFFIYDEYGNGLYVGLLDGIVDGNYLVKIGKILVIILGSGSIDNYMDYDVLVFVNVLVYFFGMDWDVYCVGQIENVVWV